MISVAVAVIAPATTLGHPVLERARLEARVEADRPDLPVTIDYLLSPEGETEIPILVIAFEPTRLGAIRAFHEDRELLVRLDSSRPPRIDGAIVLPGPVAGRDSVEIRIQYEVAAGQRTDRSDIHILLPMVVVGWAPREPTADTFIATVHLPGHAERYSSFPSSFHRLDGAGDDDASVYRAALPVLPSVLRLTASTSGRPLITFERAIDLAAVVVLLGAAVLGWRRFRRLLT